MDAEARKAYDKAYYATHKEEKKVYNKTYRVAHREELNAYNKTYYESHQEEISAQKRTHRVTHPEENKARCKAYYSDHTEEMKAYKKAHHANHRKEHNAQCKAYYNTHSEEIKARVKAYQDTHKEDVKARKKAYREEHATDIICKQCGKHAKQYIGRNAGRFCSMVCARNWLRGPNSPQWRGGVSFEPYCPKFNASLKEEVRSQFGRRCFLSGKEENGKKLAVHHCDYLKSQGCQGQRWSLLPLDHSWHAKTNFDRWHWFALLRDYWAYKYLTFHGMDIYEGPDRTAWLWEMYNQDAQT